MRERAKDPERHARRMAATEHRLPPRRTAESQLLLTHEQAP